MQNSCTQIYIFIKVHPPQPLWILFLFLEYEESIVLFFTYKDTLLESGHYLVLNPWNRSPYKMAIALLSRNDQSIKSS